MFQKALVILLASASMFFANGGNLEGKTGEEAVSETTVTEEADETAEEEQVEETKEQEDKKNPFEVTSGMAGDAGSTVVIRKPVILPIVILGIVVLFETAGLIYILYLKLNNKQQTEKKNAEKGNKGTVVPSTGSHTLRLEVECGTLLNETKEVSFEHQVLIGRGEICNIVFGDPDVSKLHARIYILDGVHYLENLSLKKGTYLDDMQIQKINRIEDGDVVQIGSARFVVHF